ncbi:Gfo/Idh/MocA family protein [Burkholderia sp. IMCC1007]|uniref:Gfo/Idh/MocA family protein n=1 Tax=Burkholderia sp. IMCC1007 TaxID=3004104 RepID=UPI0022B4A077|nr:Gfo/Idh/MocA family oxidoreductase [Burkholderia sp. IMCC1007]
MDKPFRVGIVGLSADRGWAATAHIPALRALADQFEVVGVANTSLASSQAAAAAFGIPQAFASVAELVASADIDVVIVTVKVPYHREVVSAALGAGKSVYCEWPLGNGLAEAAELARLAAEKGVVAVTGTQALASPEVAFVRRLIAEGYVGDVLSSTYSGAGFSWGEQIPYGDAYAMDSKNGATLLSVIGGHAIAAVQWVLGPVRQVDAVLSQRRKVVSEIGTGESVPMRTHDHVMINAVLQSGVPLSMQLCGGLPRGTGLLWEINGSEGDLRITAAVEQAPVINISPLRVEGGRKGTDGYQELPVPDSYYFGVDGAVTARNVAGIYRMMGDDLRTGARTAPSFDDALGLHRTLDAIEESNATGRRIQIA